MAIGWSGVESGLYTRQGKALTELSRTLPTPESELAHGLLKDPYNFEFLTFGPSLLERDLQQGQPVAQSSDA